MESLLEQSDIVRQKGRRWRKIRNIFLFVVFVILSVWLGIRYYYPYEEGVRAGKLNYVVYKGTVFKTYEGLLIQPEIISSDLGENESNEFIFSVAKEAVAERLMHAGGKVVELRYKEYFGALPWRGKSRYVVCEIISISGEKDAIEVKEGIVNTI